MRRSASDVIRRLMRTEKGTVQMPQRKYFFAVEKAATKPQIRQAVEDLFKVKVTRVNTEIMAGKPRRLRATWGYKPNWKKAVVTLAEGSKIEVAV